MEIPRIKGRSRLAARERRRRLEALPKDDGLVCIHPDLDPMTPEDVNWICRNKYRNDSIPHLRGVRKDLGEDI